jgi:hypothetical protein
MNLASHVSLHVDIPFAGALLICGKFWILQSLQVPILTCLSISVACDSRRRKASLYVTQATGFSSAYCTDKHTFNQMMNRKWLMKAMSSSEVKNARKAHREVQRRARRNMEEGRVLHLEGKSDNSKRKTIREHDG